MKVPPISSQEQRARIAETMRKAAELRAQLEAQKVPPQASKPAERVPLTTQTAKKKAPSATRQRVRRETREELLERLSNPVLTLHETAILLEVCSATVRRWCESGALPHERTVGGQRRFRFKDVMRFMEGRHKKKVRPKS